MIRLRLTEVDVLGLPESSREDLMAAIEPLLDPAVDLIVSAARSNLSRRRGTASTAAPIGEPPEYDEGQLHDSIRAGETKRTLYSVRKEYGSDHPAAGLHEYGGTTKGTKRLYPARPYMRPAEAQTEDEVSRILDRL